MQDSVIYDEQLKNTAKKTKQTADDIHLPKTMQVMPIHQL
jgi:hypothetical protein